MEDKILRIEQNTECPDRKRTEHDDESDQMPGRLIQHFIFQGLSRGCYYGAAVGVWFWVIGAFIGGVAGFAVGLLDGVILAVIAHSHQSQGGTIGDLIGMASWLIPSVTFFVCFTICLICAIVSDRQGEAFFFADTLGLKILISFIPTSIAAFASWQSVQKLWDWYVPRK